MDILELIRKRRTIRKYKSKIIPEEMLGKIIDAGIWGPSVVTFQPWKLILVTDKDIIKRLYKIVDKKIKKMGIIGTAVLNSTSKAMANAPAVILIYNKGTFVEFSSRFGKDYAKLAKLAEISAISAAIQNMILVSESLGIGTCWHDMPLFCEREINKLLEIDSKLIAVLTLGYSAEEGKRANREPFSEMVKRIK